MNIIFKILTYGLPIPILYYLYYLFQIFQKYNLKINKNIQNKYKDL
jgi:hypothetical protein